MITYEYRFKSLAELADYLRARSIEIKAIHYDTQINKARGVARALAYEEIAEIIDDSTIVSPEIV